ncbi:MAG: hypothetical protein GY851_23480 [bacterium]|nr:hypothetical protein [bacterium]
MNGKRLREELSAFLDGEAADPDRMARLVREDAEARRVYDEMRRTSAQVKRLQPPTVDPSFHTRVMAGVREPEPVGYGWIHRALIPAAVALTVLMVAGLFVYSRDAFAPTSGPEGSWAEMDPGALMAALETKLTESPEAFEAAGIAPTSGSFGLESGEPSDDLRESALDWVAGLPVDYSNETDLDTLLGSLNEEEEETLRAMLVDYAERGWTT